MKRLILFVCLLVGMIKGISQPLNTSIYTNGICNCLDSLSKNGGVHQNFPTCFLLAIERNYPAFMQELLQTYGDSSSKSIDKLSDVILIRVSIDLIGSCTSYFAYTDSLKQRQYKYLNRDSLKAALNHQDSYDESKKDKAFYQNNSTLYFQLGDYDNALKNVEKVLVQDSLNASAIFIKATIEERKGNYSDAIVLYDKVAALTKNDAILIYSALAKRKKTAL